MSEPVHHADFVEVPDDTFIRNWKDHISKSGYPETFDGVSTSQPVAIGRLELLSEIITVPTLRRDGGENVPCPLCSPIKPKFKNGRMAWFPDEGVIRFLGHDCAAKHYGDTFQDAEKRFKRESEIRNLIARWAILGGFRDELLATATPLYNVGDAIQTLRDRIDENAAGLTSLLWNTMTRNDGRIVLTSDTGLKDQKGSKVYEDLTLGQFSGLSFLDPSLDLVTKLKSAIEALRDSSTPLPNWTAGQSTPEVEHEILTRGRKVDSVPKILVESAQAIMDARDFIGDRNIGLFRIWFDSGTSPFSSLDVRFEKGQLSIRSKSFAGNHYATPLKPSHLTDEIPTISQNIRDLARKR